MPLCRIIYIEAHLILFTVNPLEARPCSPNKAALKMEPWQCKAVRSLGLTMQECALDNGRMKLYANFCSPTSANMSRNRRAYVIRRVPERGGVRSVLHPGPN